MITPTSAIHQPMLDRLFYLTLNSPLFCLIPMELHSIIAQYKTHSKKIGITLLYILSLWLRWMQLYNNVDISVHRWIRVNELAKIKTAQKNSVYSNTEQFKWNRETCFDGFLFIILPLQIIDFVINIQPEDNLVFVF